MVKITTDIPQDHYDLIVEDAKKAVRSVSQQIQFVVKVWVEDIIDDKRGLNFDSEK